MSNKRGLEVKDGKIYIDGVEYKAADDGGDTPSGPVHNTFKKICVYGTSIDASVYSPGPSSPLKTWPQVMAEKLKAMDETLDMDYGVQWTGLAVYNPPSGVVNAARSGMSLTWWGNSYPTNVYGSSNDVQKMESASVLSVYSGGSFSPTGAERLATLRYFNDAKQGLTYVDGGVTKKYIPDDMLSNPMFQSIGYDVALLGQSDVGLYILATLGINDRQTWMAFDYYAKESKTIEGEEVDVIVMKHATSYTMEDAEIWVAKVKEEDLIYDSANQCYTDLTQWEKSGHMYFDRRTIFGAYNYVLRQLYERNSNAKVVILGQHCFNWDNTNVVNEIQRTVAYVWGIPFADWGFKLHIDMPEFGVDSGDYLHDGAHVNGYGAEVLGEWVADWITNTPLTSLNPNTNVLDLNDCPINPALS